MYIVVTALNQFVLIKLSLIVRMLIDVIIGIAIYLTTLTILQDNFTKQLINRVIQLINKVIKRSPQGE